MGERSRVNEISVLKCQGFQIVIVRLKSLLPPDKPNSGRPIIHTNLLLKVSSYPSNGLSMARSSREVRQLEDCILPSLSMDS